MQTAVAEKEDLGSAATNPSPAAEHDAQGRRIWRVGNLVYTKPALIGLFFWLLWADFAFTLMEHAFGPILKFKLANDLKAPAFVTILFMSILPRVQTFFLNPLISISSDRHRGRRGRRIPFLLYPTPIVCALLALMGFGDDIASWLSAHVFTSLSPTGVAVAVWGILYFTFTIFNLFLSCVFYYLCNDVVPKEHIVKFMAYFRAVTTGAGILYSWYIYGYSDKSGPLNLGFVRFDHIWYPKVILVGMAAFYLVAFSIACLKIKEPAYPPPPPLAEGEGVLERISSTLRTLVRECFGHPFYIFFFFTMTIEWMQHQMSTFYDPMLKELGLNISTVGRINSVASLVTLVLTILTANYGDRFKAVPLYLAGTIALAVTAPVGFLYLIPGLSTKAYYTIYIIYQVTHVPVGIIVGMAWYPLTFEMLPRARFGQFSAALVMTREFFAGIIGSFAAAGLSTWLQHLHGGTFYTRYCYPWKGFWQIMLLVCAIILYRKWKKMGGRDAFRAPEVSVAS